MKIINSHYIPMPEPRWLIITPIGEIYDQIGTLSVVEEAPGKKGKYGIKTHNHPVVVSADKDTMQEKKDCYDFTTSLTLGNGKVLDDVLVDNCIRVCPTDHRTIDFMRFNCLAMNFMTGEYFEDFSLEEFIEELRGCGIKFLFPKKEEQEMTLTTFEGDTIGMIISDPLQMFFAVPFWAVASLKDGIQIEYDKILMEFVNQARIYLTINPKYKFHFSTSIDVLEEVVDKLNNELENYLDRKEE